MRHAQLRALAKVNLDLRVLHKRADGYHEIRTVFQTISLADRIEVSFTPSRKTSIVLTGSDIPDNLIVRAAQAVFDAVKATGVVEFRLDKRIPMGAGLGGGSSDAAAVLLALPVLAGKRIDAGTLARLGAALGSDVPFFLYGGTALGIGRGTELYPLPDAPPSHGLVVAPGIHVSTPEAYRDLNRLTSMAADGDTGKFEVLVWGMDEDSPGSGWTAGCANDFESAVFGRHPLLRKIRDRLRHEGAKPALMSGSGSSLFGLWASRERRADAMVELAGAFGSQRVQLHKIELVNRRRYRALWWKQLGKHITGETWPPQSRYAQK